VGCIRPAPSAVMASAVTAASSNARNPVLHECFIAFPCSPFFFQGGPVPTRRLTLHKQFETCSTCKVNSYFEKNEIFQGFGFTRLSGPGTAGKPGNPWKKASAF